MFFILNSAVVDQKQDEIDSRIDRLDTKIKAISRAKVDDIVVSSSLEIEAPKDERFHSISSGFVRIDKSFEMEKRTYLKSGHRHICTAAKNRDSRPRDKNTIPLNNIDDGLAFKSLRNVDFQSIKPFGSNRLPKFGRSTLQNLWAAAGVTELH